MNCNFLVYRKCPWKITLFSHYFAVVGCKVFNKYVCLCVCLFVCLTLCLSVRTTQELHGRTSRNRPIYACCLWPWLGLPLPTLRYVMYLWFMDNVTNVMFLYHRVNWPETSTALFRRVRQVAVPVGRHTTTVIG